MTLVVRTIENITALFQLYLLGLVLACCVEDNGVVAPALALTHMPCLDLVDVTTLTLRDTAPAGCHSHKSHGQYSKSVHSRRAHAETHAWPPRAEHPVAALQ